MNMIQNAKDQVLDLTVAAYGKAAAQGLLPEDVAVTPSVEIPKDTANGDYTTTFCLAAAKALKKNPRQVAQILMDHMDLAGSYFTSVEMAGPGFLNFRLGDKWFRDTVACVEREGADYGCNDTLKGQKIMVEFVSANPTGPMHMGNARGGVLGDTLASVLQKSGANVWREFYVNDAGNQIEKFAKSLEARYLQIIKGEDAVEFPEDGYHGDDIRELARAFYEKEGDKYLDCDEKTRHDALARFGLDNNIPKMQRDLARYGIQYDQWFFESSLHESGYVADSVRALTDLGFTYEKDGALWLHTSRILAENPAENFRPCAGKVTLLHVPGGPWVRFDTALYQDYTIPPFYDSMIAKLIVHAPTRAEAIRKMQAALCEMVIEGVEHTGWMQSDLIAERGFEDGTYTTDYLSGR